MDATTYQLETDVDDGATNPSVHTSESVAVERLQQRYDGGEPITSWAIVSIDDTQSPGEGVETVRAGTAWPEE